MQPHPTSPIGSPPSSPCLHDSQSQKRRRKDKGVSLENILPSLGSGSQSQSTSSGPVLGEFICKQLTRDFEIDVVKTEDVFGKTLAPVESKITLMNAAKHYKVARLLENEKDMEFIERFCLDNLSIENFHHCFAILPASEIYRSELYNFLCMDELFSKIAIYPEEYMSEGVKAGVRFLKEHSSNLILNSECKITCNGQVLNSKKEMRLLFSNNGLKKLHLDMMRDESSWVDSAYADELLKMLKKQSNLEELTLNGYIFEESFRSLKYLARFPSLKCLTILNCGMREYPMPSILNEKHREKIRQFLSGVMVIFAK